MNVDFQIVPLASKMFSPYFRMSAEELRSIGAYTFQSDEDPCYPCRVSLKDAQIGETVLALEYEHHAVKSPYRSSGPIFVRENADEAKLKTNEIPDMLNHRLLSVRSYNVDGLMVAADTTRGSDLRNILNQQFEIEVVKYIHIHNASPGCFNCTVKRA